jgi:hypothetical protein
VRKILPRNSAETLSVPRVENYLPETLNVPAITRLLESVSAAEGAADVLVADHVTKAPQGEDDGRGPARKA